MRVRRLLAAAVVCGVMASMPPPTAEEVPTRLSIVPASQVRIADEFWTPRIEANRKVSIQAVYDRSAPRTPAQLIEAPFSKRQSPSCVFCRVAGQRWPCAQVASPLLAPIDIR